MAFRLAVGLLGRWSRTVTERRTSVTRDWTNPRQPPRDRIMGDAFCAHAHIPAVRIRSEVPVQRAPQLDQVQVRDTSEGSGALVLLGDKLASHEARKILGGHSVLASALPSAVFTVFSFRSVKVT